MVNMFPCVLENHAPNPICVWIKGKWLKFIKQKVLPIRATLKQTNYLAVAPKNTGSLRKLSWIRVKTSS